MDDISVFFKTVLFSVGSISVTLGQLLGYALVLVLLYVLRWFLGTRLLPRYYDQGTADTTEAKKLNRIIWLLFGLLGILVGVFIFNLDYTLYAGDSFKLKISSLLVGLCVFQLARLLDWLISTVLLHNYYQNRAAKKESKPTQNSLNEGQGERKAKRSIQYIVYIVAALFFIRIFKIENAYLDFSTPDQTINLSLTNVLTAILILIAARLLSLLFIQFFLTNYYKRNDINVGSQYAINQLLKYVIYVIAILVALDQLGIQMKLIWGGAAALLVGVGLGLQQTFNDLISGVILLFERTVEVEDVVDINGLVGKVKKIGLRTSLVETFDNITVIVPNSKLIVDNVINWSHYDDKARFSIVVGVEYGSDTMLVKKLLLRAARENVYVLDYPTSIVRFTDFGDSALVFELRFWTRNFIVIEDIRSDLRFTIDQLFREHDITIPFPQRVVWHKPSEEK